MIQEKRGHAEDLEPAPDRAHLLALPVRHVPDAQRARAVGARLRADRAVGILVPRLSSRPWCSARRLIVAPAGSCERRSGSSRSLSREATSWSTTALHGAPPIVFWGTLFPMISEAGARGSGSRSAAPCFNKLRAAGRARRCSSSPASGR